MIITDYRVKSVLRTYAKQLQRAKLQKKNPGVPSSSSEKVTISEEAKKQLIFMGLSKQALNKVPKDNEKSVDDKTGEEKTENLEKDQEQPDGEMKTQGA